MSKQHLHFFAVAAGLGIIFRFGNGACHIAGRFMDIAWHLAKGHFCTALGFERARAAIVGAGPIEQRRTVIDEGARGPQGFIGRADINVALFVIGKVFT